MADRTNQHVMLSYQWDDKEDVLQVYDGLTSQGYSVWMDVKGGMGENLQESMAVGVERSWALVCFLTPAYQESKNCQRELTYANEQRKPIIPVYMVDKWKASGWLGLILAGAVYIRRSSSGLTALTSAIVERLYGISPDRNCGKSSDIFKSIQQKNDRLACGGRCCSECNGCRDWNNGPDGGCRYHDATADYYSATVHRALAADLTICACDT